MTRKQVYFAGIAACAILPSSASAETLQQALEGAYRNNPTISAQRASIRVAEEDVPLARAAGMPTVDGSATYQENVLTGKPAPSGFFSNPDRQLVGQINANVPMFDFGGVRGSMNAAKARLEASHFGMNKTEADLFSAVVGAYMDVLRDEAVVGLNRNNVDVMRYTVKEADDRRRAGSRGPTDVAQAEARLALAESQLETAGARLISSKEQYLRLVGRAPENLELPPPLPQMPASPTDAVEMALANNPEIASARVQRTAAGYDIDVARSQAYPRLSAIGGLNQYDYLGSLEQGTGPRNGDRGTTAFVGVTLKMPILDGGRTGATGPREAGCRRQTGAGCRRQGHCRNAIRLRDMAGGDQRDRHGAARGQRQPAGAGGDASGSQRGFAPVARPAQCRTGTTQCPGHDADRAA